jgi:signal transduction histidine kinase
MIRLPRRTARLRLTALYAGLFLISGLALVGGTYVLFQHVTTPSQPHLPPIPHTPTIHPLRQGPPQLPQALFTLTQAQHQLAHDQNQLKTLPLGTSGAKSVGGLLGFAPQLVRDEHQLNKDQHRLAAAVHQLAQAEHEVAQTGAAQAAQRASDSHELLVDSGIALAVVAALALLAGWLVAGRMLRPIRTITKTARRISSTSLHERLALAGPEDELKELGDTLDDLFARLEASFEAQRRFVAHASHELRTPLTRERALLQVALGDPSTSDAWRAAGEELLTSNREQETLIDALLTLASSESGLDQRKRVDLADLLRASLDKRRDADAVGLQIDESLQPAFVEGDPRLIERLVANLVDNAVAHNVEGGTVHVSTGSSDGGAVLTVMNTGPVIPPSEIDRLFQPFQRLDPGRLHHGDRHGLGLSIVRAIALAHDATITADSLRDGGLSIEVVFPPLPARVRPWAKPASPHTLPALEAAGGTQEVSR